MGCPEFPPIPQVVGSPRQTEPPRTLSSWELPTFRISSASGTRPWPSRIESIERRVGDVHILSVLMGVLKYKPYIIFYISNAPNQQGVGSCALAWTLLYCQSGDCRLGPFRPSSGVGCRFTASADRTQPEWRSASHSDFVRCPHLGLKGLPASAGEKTKRSNFRGDSPSNKG